MAATARLGAHSFISSELPSHGAKLILGISSSSDCVPSTYIKKYLPLNSPVDIILHDVNPDGWLDLDGSYPPDVIADTLVTMERMLKDNADSPTL